MFKLFTQKIVANPDRSIGASPALIILFIVSAFVVAAPFSHADDATEKTYYFLTDHLGSVDVVLDEQGNVVERADYMPYGDDRLRVDNSTSGNDDHKFTGKEKDDETGLYYYGARYYDPKIGRFTQIDPLILGESDKPLSDVLQNPQALNGYSYVLNNPMKYVDENGEWNDFVHYDVTKDAAEIAGFNRTQAMDIGLYDNDVDTNPNTEPGTNLLNYETGVTKEYHFATHDEALAKVQAAIESQNLESFSRALHTLQDTYSHTMSPEAHVLYSALDKFVKGYDPDRADYHPIEAYNAIYESYSLMRNYLRWSITDKDDLKKFDEETITKWDNSKGEIYKKISNGNDNKKDNDKKTTNKSNKK